MPEATRSHEDVLTADFGFTILDFGLYLTDRKSRRCPQGQYQKPQNSFSTGVMVSVLTSIC